MVGARLRYRVVADGRTRCLGHTDRSGDGPSHVDCDRPASEGRQCDRCRTTDNVVAASMHQAHRLGRGAVDGRVAGHLDQPHRLYVAAFRDGSLKVGTTAGASGGSRLVEQGAWSARYVARAADGFAVRDAEDLATETVGVRQAVTVSRKIAGLVHPRSDEELAATLESTAQQVKNLVAAMGDARLEPIDEPWFNPAVGAPWLARVVRYPTTVDSGAHDLEVIGAVGRVLAVRRPGFDEVFVVDPAPLFGVEIDLGDHEADEVAVQAALF